MEEHQCLLILGHSFVSIIYSSNSTEKQYKKKCTYDKDGKLIQEYNLKGHNMYYYTGEIMAWMASKIKVGEINEYGVVGAVRAFGIDELEKAHAEIDFYIEK